MSDPTIPQLPGPGAPKEPLITVGALVAVVTAVVGLVVAFGVRVNDDQQAAILGVVAVVAPFVVALVGRLKVWSPASVRAVVRRELVAKGRDLPTTDVTDVRDR